LFSRANPGKRVVVVVVNLSGMFLGKYLTNFVFLFTQKIFSFRTVHYRVPNLPVNGWWHEWTLNYDVKVDRNKVHLDLAEREAKIVVWFGENWQPTASESQPESSVESILDNNNTDTTETNTKNS
jgi:hypothetical protein